MKRKGARGRDPPGCVRDCLSLPIPSQHALVGVLRELARRGDVSLDERRGGGDAAVAPSSHAPEGHAEKAHADDAAVVARLGSVHGGGAWPMQSLTPSLS